MGGRPSPAVLRIAERGRRNILCILLLYCFSFNDFVVDGNLEVDELNVTITSGMVTTLSYRMGCCRGYYP